MNKYIKRPLPNVEDAKHAIDCMLAGCSEDEFYNKYTPQMVTTNEFYQIRELENHIKPDAKVLTVCASGEQPLFFKLYGAKNILTFDVSYNSYLLMSLKVSALQLFDKSTEYYNFIDCLYNNHNKLLTNPSICNVIEKLGKVERDYIYQAVDVVPVFWAAASCYFYNIPQNDYDKLRKLVKTPFKFIWTDITSLGDKLKGKYVTFDIIYYSNILEFMQPYYIRQVLEYTSKHINPNGKLFLTVRYNRIDLIMGAIDCVYDSPDWNVQLLPEKYGFCQIIIQRMQKQK